MSTPLIYPALATWMQAATNCRLQGANRFRSWIRMLASLDYIGGSHSSGSFSPLLSRPCRLLKVQLFTTRNTGSLSTQDIKSIHDYQSSSLVSGTRHGAPTQGGAKTTRLQGSHGTCQQQSGRHFFLQCPILWPRLLSKRGGLTSVVASR